MLTSDPARAGKVIAVQQEWLVMGPATQRAPRSGTAALLRGVAEADLARAHDRLRARARIELAENARDVVAYGLRADRESPGDVVVAEAACDELEHLALAFGQVVEPGARRRMRGRLRGRKKSAQFAHQMRPGRLVLEDQVV